MGDDESIVDAKTRPDMVMPTEILKDKVLINERSPFLNPALSSNDSPIPA